jgi:hypothetical protein
VFYYLSTKSSSVVDTVDEKKEVSADYRRTRSTSLVSRTDVAQQWGRGLTVVSPFLVF